MRCTRIARKRLHLPEELPASPASTGKLGDWYAHLVRFGRPEFAVVTNERTLLTILFPARDFRTILVPTLYAHLELLLKSLDVPPAAIVEELAAMKPVAFARATDRRILGSMNELAFHASHRLAHSEDLAGISRALAEIPMSALGSKRGDYGYPENVARKLLISSAG